MKIKLGLPSVLLIVFLILKLTDNIDWSWWWVLSPAWIPIVLGIIILLLLSIFKVEWSYTKRRLK